MSYCTLKEIKTPMTFAPQVFPGIVNVSERFNGILLDAYGVFWGGNEEGLLPGALEAMAMLVERKKIVGILSNSTQLSAHEVDKLAKHGLKQGTHFHFLITSGEIGREIYQNEKLPFPTPNKKYALLGDVHPRFSSHLTIFDGSSYQETKDWSEADFLYISIPHVNGKDQTNPDLFLPDVERAIASTLPVVCPNPDLYAHEGKPAKTVVRQGSIALMVEKRGGLVHYIGKPSYYAYETAMNEFKKYKIVFPTQILMVGDTPETDIRGARRFGMSSALVTQTGLMADRIRERGLAATLISLPQEDTPDYYLGKLCNDL